MQFSPHSSLSTLSDPNILLNTLVSDIPSLYIYRVFQKELYNFEGLYKFIQMTCTVI
jgi:hypothetical protein